MDGGWYGGGGGGSAALTNDTEYYSGNAGKYGSFGIGGKGGDYTNVGTGPYRLLSGLVGAGGSNFVYSSATSSWNSTVNSNLGSTYYFSSTVMSSGSSSFNNTSGTGLETGHSGNGYVKITTLK